MIRFRVSTSNLSLLYDPTPDNQTNIAAKRCNFAINTLEDSVATIASDWQRAHLPDWLSGSFTGVTCNECSESIAP